MEQMFDVDRKTKINELAEELTKWKAKLNYCKAIALN